MSWLITVGPGAERDIRKLDAKAQNQIVAALDKLSADPWTAGAEKTVSPTKVLESKVGKLQNHLHDRGASTTAPRSADSAPARCLS